MTQSNNSYIKKHGKYLDNRIAAINDYVSRRPDEELLVGIIDFLTDNGAPFLPAQYGPIAKPLDEIKKLIETWDILHEGDIIGYIYEQIQSRKDRKYKGQFFTQEDMVDLIVSQSLECSDKESIRVLDPACGSGQFLIAALKHLTARTSLDIREITAGLIHGSDIDPVAVSIAKYNLSRISGCSMDEINVRCTDYLCRDELNLSSVHQPAPSYDLIIGNPPWGSGLANKNKKYYLDNYYSARSGLNTFTLFIERSFDFINSTGVISFLLPEAFLNIRGHKNTRKLVLENARIRAITVCGELFKGVFAPAISITMQRESSDDERNKSIVEIHSLAGTRNTAVMVPQSSFHSTPDNIFNINYTRKAVNIINSVNGTDCFYLKGKAKFFLGIVTGNNALHVSNERSEEYPDPIIIGRDVQQYRISFGNHYFKYDRDRLQQVAPRHLYTTPDKILYKFIGKRLTFALDTEGYFSLNNVNGFIPEYSYINIESTLSILNSSVIQYFYEKNFFTIKVLRGDLERLPIKILSKESQIRIKKIARNILSSPGKDFTRERETIEDIIFHEYGISDRQAYYISEYLQ
ncbi:MAG TPA: N-6 DNA methylase [Spirochaetota bacterium]|nr:N-6 DNA methylase [Spirochaetota bacterium]